MIQGDILNFSLFALALLIGIPIFLVIRRAHLRLLLRQRAKALARLHTEVVGLRQRREFATQFGREIFQAPADGRYLIRESGD